jgi:SAM-dependent methyltransferase
MKYHKLVTALLSDFIIELAEGRPVDLLELGCGFGGTLMGVAIRLSQTLQLCKITGLDISESGLQILNKMSAVEGIPISTVIHDFGADIPIPKMQGGETNARVAFTNFSLSAITTYHKNPITNILRNSGAKYVIILEPMMMDKDNITLASLLTGRHIINNSYNPDIRSYINSSCNDGLCKVLYNHNEIIGSSIASAISICVLESNC